jgi:hypothetical protein
MTAEYRPDLQNVKRVDFRPYMVESAYDYCLTVLLSAHKRGTIQKAMGALAIEIVLKSYHSQPVANLGTLDERYGLDRSALPVKRSDLHDLRVLREHLRPDVRLYLLDKFDDEVIDEHHNAFMTSRYAYEATAPSGTSDSTIRLAMKLVCNTVYLYKHFGCQDPFVHGFDVSAVYFRFVQPLMRVRREA